CGAWNGIRTRYLMIISHLLYPNELPSQGRNRPTWTNHGLRTAEHETAERPAPAGVLRTRTKAARRSALMIEVERSRKGKVACGCTWVKFSTRCDAFATLSRRYGGAHATFYWRARRSRHLLGCLNGKAALHHR